MTKTCARCKETYPATTEHFYKDNRAANRLQAWCKKCVSDYTKKYKKAKVSKADIKAPKKMDLPKFKAGQGVRVGSRHGKISGAFKHFVVVDFKRYKESFLYADIYCGDVKIS